MVLFLPGITIPAFFGQRAVAVTFFFMKLWSWIFSKLTFIRYEIIDRHKIPKGEAFIYVSNHTSFLDLPGIAMTIRRQFRPLAKKELLKLPVFGLVTRATCVVVDRSSSESRKKSMNYLAKILKMGINILIFPEGTQNRSPEILQPFKEGAFRIAFDTKQRIMPLAVIGAGKLMPPGKAKVFPGLIKIVVGDSIAVEGSDQKEITELKEKTTTIIKEMILKNS
jgi:1-acyl-sn-glycerol-3-phosphate acyltransferase